jgi:hypothetical protein
VASACGTLLGFRTRLTKSDLNRGENGGRRPHAPEFNPIETGWACFQSNYLDRRVYQD